jgi:hypothetical protein
MEIPRWLRKLLLPDPVKVYLKQRKQILQALEKLDDTQSQLEMELIILNIKKHFTPEDMERHIQLANLLQKIMMLKNRVVTITRSLT